MSKTRIVPTKSDDIAIKVSNVSKTFKLPHEKQGSIKGLFVNMFRGKRTYEKQQVLKDISFEIKKGEFFGIVGRNGSGKSTLLKLLSGIYTPDKGHIQISGKLTPFIELGVGFNPELTGRENVFLNGALLGFNRKEMLEMYQEIVEFAELENFMDQKLKNYSSGMQVRLAFSIATRAKADILVLDEVLAVGDEAFQRKCFQYFSELKRKRKTVVLVTHSMDSVTRFCNKALMLDAGEIVENGSVKSVAESYINKNLVNAEDDGIFAGKDFRDVDNPYVHTTVELADKNKKTKRVFKSKPEDGFLNFRVSLNIKKDIEKDTFLSLVIKNANGEAIMRVSSEDIEASDVLRFPRKGDQITMSAQVQNILGEGSYFAAVSFKSVDRSESYMELEDKMTFKVYGLGKNGYSLRPGLSIKIEGNGK